MKRQFDFIFSVFSILISLPLWLVIGLGIWLIDLGPVFYFQERVGRNGRIFRSIQFRSMKRDADRLCGPLQAKDGDARVTRLGRILRATAMDELPQLLNIAFSDMSFVGPRPLRPVEIDSGDLKPKSIWEFKGAKERCSVKPGLTGIAQILAPRDVSREDKFRFDIWYIKNQSFFLDVYIIFVSFLITFGGRWERKNRNLNSFLAPLHSWVNRDLSKV